MGSHLTELSETVVIYCVPATWEKEIPPPPPLSLAYGLTEADPESVSVLAASAPAAAASLPAASAPAGAASVGCNTKAS